MKQFPTNLTGKHPETQVQLRKAAGHRDGEISSVTPGTHHIFTGNLDPFAEDRTDMEQVEYSERPYLSDEKWFV